MMNPLDLYETQELIEALEKRNESFVFAMMDREYNINGKKPPTRVIIKGHPVEVQGLASMLMIAISPE